MKFLNQGKARRGGAWQEVAWLGNTRQGAAWRGKDRHG
jgi:hypothetical protein